MIAGRILRSRSCICIKINVFHSHLITVNVHVSALKKEKFISANYAFFFQALVAFIESGEQQESGQRGRERHTVKDQ